MGVLYRTNATYRLFNRRPPRGETAAPLLFPAILSKRLSEYAVNSKKAQCEKQVCLGFIRRVLGWFLADSRRNLGKFSAETRQVLGGPKNSLREAKRLSKRQPEGGQKTPRMPKRRRKGRPKASQSVPKLPKKRGCISKPFSDVSGMTARVFYHPFWVYFGSQNR